GGGGALETLTRLWLLGDPVPRVAAARALPGLVDRLLAAEALGRDGDEVRARLDLRPLALGDRERWVVADRRRFLDGTAAAPQPDHVVGPSAAATSLTQLTVRRPAGRALDLGTGCGIQALLARDHCDEVVATDVNARALRLAAINAALDDTILDLRRGDLFDPVAGERFDLVVSNPPFVVGPAGGGDIVYRDSGLPGDEVVRRVVVGAARHLAPGGVAQVLGNWAHVVGEPWEERLRGWLDQAGVGLDAWVVQREVADPATYVELWLRDAGLRSGPAYLRRYDEWLAWFEEQRVTGVGMGWIVLRRTDREQPQLRLEDWPHPVEQPLGTEVADWLDRADRLAVTDDDTVLRTAWVLRPDVQEETLGAPGRADPSVIVLRQQRGMRRARRLDTVQAALVGACDGELSAGVILEAVGSLLDVPVEPREHVATIRELVAEGYLTPPR
ncbi:MAG TPA: methyltransferase, partial [Marmoricola sp.]|nr:methyltransferase [Marmoricola sp.]